MDQIKFRGWDGSKMHFFDLKDLYNEGCEANLMHDEPHLSHNTQCHYLSMSIMQFIGFLDKDSKEIFEGDILEVCGLKGVINFNHGCFLWNLTEPFTIVGNIYEPPELLQEKSC